MNVSMVVAKPAHAGLIVNFMREHSKEEVARIGLDIKNVIASAIERSRYTWLGLIDEKIVCMLGVECETLLSDVGYVWMITTEEAERHPFIFVRYSQRFVEALQNRFRILHGYVDKRNKRSVLWLKWLGFSITSVDVNEHWWKFEKRRA